MIFGSYELTEIVLVLSALASIAAAVLALIFITPDKKRAKLNGLGKFVHDLCNFKFLVVEKIFQFFYIVSTSYILIFGFFYLFAFEKKYSYSYYGSRSSSEWVGYIGLLIMILGPIAIRIAYEFIMMAIIAIKNIIQINNKLKNQNDDGTGTSPFGEPSVKDYISAKPAQPVYTAPVAPAPATGFCTKCGSPKVPGGFCPNCGSNN